MLCLIISYALCYLTSCVVPCCVMLWYVVSCSVMCAPECRHIMLRSVVVGFASYATLCCLMLSSVVLCHCYATNCHCNCFVMSLMSLSCHCHCMSCMCYCMLSYVILSCIVSLSCLITYHTLVILHRYETCFRSYVSL